MADIIRAFIAIPLSDEIHKELSGLQEKLKAAGTNTKWVEPANIHLTLKFLGNIGDEQIEKIKMILQEVAKNIAPFDIEIDEIGAFPQIDYPRVIWAGVSPGKDELAKIAGELEEKLAKIGFEKETRAFSPHLTLGRVRTSKNKTRLKEIIQKLKPRANRAAVNKIILFQSTLTPKGPVYEPIFEARIIPR